MILIWSLEFTVVIIKATSFFFFLIIIGTRSKLQSADRLILMTSNYLLDLALKSQHNIITTKTISTGSRRYSLTRWKVCILFKSLISTSVVNCCGCYYSEFVAYPFVFISAALFWRRLEPLTVLDNWVAAHWHIIHSGRVFIVVTNSKKK